MRSLTLVREEGTLEWYALEGGHPFALVIHLSQGATWILEYVESEAEAKSMAHHFAQCLHLARLEGFTLQQDYFVHSEGISIPVGEALCLTEKPGRFQKTLQTLNDRFTYH